MLLALGKVHKKQQIKLSLCFTLLHPEMFLVQVDLYLTMYLEICNFTSQLMILSDFSRCCLLSDLCKVFRNVFCY